MESENQLGSKPLADNPMLGCMLSVRPENGQEERKSLEDDISDIFDKYETPVAKLT